MVNPFTIVPGSDFGSGLHALSRSLENVAEIKARERAEEKFERIKTEAMEVFKTGDPDKIATFMIKNPEMAKAVEMSYTFHDNETKKNYINSAYKLLEIHERGGLSTPSPKRQLEEMPKEFYDPIPGLPETGRRLSTMGVGVPEGGEELPPDPLDMATLETRSPEEGEVMQMPLPFEMQEIIDSRKQLLRNKNVSPEQMRHTEAFEIAYQKDPETAIKQIEHDLATMDPKGWKAWKEIYRPEEAGTGPTNLKKLIDERERLMKDDPTNPLIEAYNEKIFGKSPKKKDVAPSNIQKMMNERDVLIDQLTKQGVEDPLEHPDVKAFNRKILGDQGKTFSPSGMKKLIDEREAMAAQLAKEGATEEEIASNPYIKAYDNKIAGIDIDMEEFSDDEINYWGQWVNLTGKMPSLGRGKQATKLRAAIAKSAAEQALAQNGVTGKATTPMDAALKTVARSADTKAITSSITLLDKQMSAMDSFIQNMESQAAKMEKLGQDLYSFDTRLFNVPRRFVLNKIKGSPLQAKWEMYLTEIENEIGRLASGSPQSIAELSTHAQEKWDKIHDKNLSVKDTLSLIDETKAAARMRLKSVQDALGRTRTRMRTRKYPGEYPTIDTQEEYNNLKSGDWYIDKQTGKPARKP